MSDPAPDRVPDQVTARAADGRLQPVDLCGLLAEPERLRVFAAVVLGARTPDQVAAAADLTVREAERALRRLVRGGAIHGVDGKLRAGPDAFKDAVRAHVPQRPAGEPVDPDPRRDAVLRTFIVDGRLVQMPAAYGKRRIVLEHIAAVFDPGVRYPEPEVNAIVRAWYDDHAALRRYLVDEQLLTREGGVYWRTGGHVDVRPDHQQTDPPA